MMKKIENISWNQWMELGQRQNKYILVMVIFAVFGFYAVVVVPEKPPKKSKSSSSQFADRVEWNITTEKPEKVFSGALQGLSGDWYRMSVSTVASRPVWMDVILSSVWSEDVSIGSLDIVASDDPRYHERVFQIPAGNFSDVKFVLRGEDTGESWSYAGVRVAEFALSRLNVRNKFEADRLVPTLAGTIEHTTKMLAVSKPVANSRVIFESRFVAEADFIESIRLNAKEKSKNSSYVLELREAAKEDGTGKKDAALKKVILAPGELDSNRDEWGNQSVPLPVRLERGKEYLVTLTGTGDASRNIVLSPLEGSQQVVADEKNIATITFGRYEGGAMISGARVEDFGSEMLYTYSLSREVNDFFNLFDTEGSVKFDTKEKIIVGKQQQRTSFTYRFFTVYPFQKFMLAARQADNTENEIKLEYSFDNTFWGEVPFTQKDKEPQVFLLSLTGTGAERVVYVRASYNGEDKKTGSFGLDQLSVRAELIRK